jgi:RNA polymerase sigma factor (sigma-70 family)
MDTKRFRELMGQMRAGSADAAWELVETYGPHIQRVVRRMMDDRLRTAFDSEDFAQAVWASLIRAPDCVREIDEPGQFMRFLGRLAKNKVIDEVRRKTAKKRDPGRVESLDDPDVEPDSKTATHQDTPSQWAMAREKWEQLVHKQPARNRRILELRLAGMSYVDIARRLNIDECTVRRVVNRLLKDHAA